MTSDKDPYNEDEEHCKICGEEIDSPDGYNMCCECEDIFARKLISKIKTYEKLLKIYGIKIIEEAENETNE